VWPRTLTEKGNGSNEQPVQAGTRHRADGPTSPPGRRSGSFSLRGHEALR